MTPSDMIGFSLRTLKKIPYIPTMLKFYQFCAIAATLLIATAAPAQNAPPSLVPEAIPPAANDADKAVDEAVSKIARLKSAAADLVQTVEMLGQKFQIKGRYLRDAKARRIYLRLDVSGLPGAEGTVVQVCDGDTLWDYQRILGSPMYRKLKIGPVFEKLNAPEFDDAFRDQIISQLGFSGPEELLRGLRRTVRFTRKEPGELQGKKVWVIRGDWRDREGLVGPNQQPLPLNTPLPAYVPSFITLWLGQEDGWPYQVKLEGKKPSVLYEEVKRYGPDGRLAGAARKQKIQVTTIDLTYNNVVLNPALKIDEFVFQAPPEARVEDSTTAILSGLEQQIQLKVAQKKQEAARTIGGAVPEGDDVLKKSLDVPIPKSADDPVKEPKAKPTEE